VRPWIVLVVCCACSNLHVIGPFFFQAGTRSDACIAPFLFSFLPLWTFFPLHPPHPTFHTLRTGQPTSTSLAGGMQHQQQSLRPQQQKQQQQQQQHRRTRSRHQPTTQAPPPPSYLRILFPRHIQQREPVPQFLKTPHPDLDAEAYHFLALLVRDFIQTWYTKFSSDTELVAAVVNVVHHIARELETRSQQVKPCFPDLSIHPSLSLNLWKKDSIIKATGLINAMFLRNRSIGSLFYYRMYLKC
jgi:hypothetical protein